jgi:hypothetical protein
VELVWDVLKERQKKRRRNRTNNNIGKIYYPKKFNKLIEMYSLSKSPTRRK